MPDKSVREELTELTEAVRELRDREVADTLRDLRAEVERLRTERDTNHCVGCHCMHIHYQPYGWTYPGTVTYPSYVVTCASDSTITTTNVASGYNPAVTTFSISN